MQKERKELLEAWKKRLQRARMKSFPLTRNENIFLNCKWKGNALDTLNDT